MQAENLESVIFTKVKTLNKNQKSDVLEYLDGLPKEIHSTKVYRRKALKQIREALANL
jgi:hypothetical protein